MIVIGVKEFRLRYTRLSTEHFDLIILGLVSEGQLGMIDRISAVKYHYLSFR